MLAAVSSFATWDSTPIPAPVATSDAAPATTVALGTVPSPPAAEQPAEEIATGWHATWTTEFSESCCESESETHSPAPTNRVLTTVFNLVFAPQSVIANVDEDNLGDDNVDGAFSAPLPNELELVPVAEEPEIVALLKPLQSSPVMVETEFAAEQDLAPGDPQQEVMTVAIIQSPLAVAEQIQPQFESLNPAVQSTVREHSPAPESHQPTEPETRSPMPPAPDKGELLWSADLEVQPPKALPSEGAARGDAAKPVAPLAHFSASEQDHQEQAGGSGNRRQRGPSEKEQPTTALGQMSDQPTQPESFPASINSPSSSPTPVTSPVEPSTAEKSPDQVLLEPARALAPRQVATVQVRLDEPGSGNAPLRLIVSQRGENIDVRLRSASPVMAQLIPADMQPVIESLARQGIVERSAAHSRAVEAISATSELSRSGAAASEQAGQRNQSQNQDQPPSQDAQQNQRHSQGGRQNRRRQMQGLSFQSLLGNSARS